jgi:hypothetical protein
MSDMDDDYDIKANIRSIQDARRGYSISDACPIVSVGQRQLDRMPVKRSNKPQILEGMALWYHYKHNYKGRIELFEKGCFDGSLFGVMFKIDHEILGPTLGDQDDNTLELIDSDIGVAFRLKLQPGHLELLNGRDEMSPCYIEHRVETQNIGGDTVRVIKSASLFEISACFVGSMRNTFAVVKNADAVGPLNDDVKTSFASEAAAMRFTRALRNLQYS